MASIFSGSGGRHGAIYQANLGRQLLDEADYQIGIGRRDASEALTKGRDWALRELTEREPTALNYLQGGADRAHAIYGQAIDRFDPYVNAGQNALQAYQGAVGLGGADARQAAVDSYRATPGYEYRTQQATDQAMRNAARMGITGSGNTLAGVTRLSDNLADQDYDQHLERLQGLTSTGMTATGAQAGIQGQQAGLAARLGEAQSGLVDQNTARRAGLYTGTGQNLANVYQTSTGQGLSALTNYGNQAQQAAQTGIQAGQTAAQNRFGAIMGVADLGVKALGTAMGVPPIPTGMGGSSGGGSGGGMSQMGAMGSNIGNIINRFGSFFGPSQQQQQQAARIGVY